MGGVTLFKPSLCSFISAVLLSRPYLSWKDWEWTVSGFDKPRIPYSVSRSMRRSLYSSLFPSISTKSYSLEMGSISSAVSAMKELKQTFGTRGSSFQQSLVFWVKLMFRGRNVRCIPAFPPPLFYSLFSPFCIEVKMGIVCWCILWDESSVTLHSFFVCIEMLWSWLLICSLLFFLDWKCKWSIAVM